MAISGLDETEEAISDEELCELALRGDPDAPLSDDAMPLRLPGPAGASLLPTRYMPPVVATLKHRWRRPVAMTLVIAFLFIEAAGLCSTYGQLVIP